jgi:hypothetical protein
MPVFLEFRIIWGDLGEDTCKELVECISPICVLRDIYAVNFQFWDRVFLHLVFV